MITMTNAEAARHLASIKAQAGLETVLPAVVGYKIVRNMRSLASALAPYEEMRDKIIRKYAKTGNIIRREEDPDSYTACCAELEPLDALEVHVDIMKFSFSLIESRDLPLKTLFALEFMLE